MFCFWWINMNAAFYHKNLPYNFTFFCKVKALFVEDSLLFFLAETGETLSFSAWVDELLKTEVDPKEELSANDVGLLGLAPLGQDERDADVVSGLDSFKFEDVFDVVVFVVFEEFLEDEMFEEDDNSVDVSDGFDKDESVCGRDGCWVRRDELWLGIADEERDLLDLIDVEPLELDDVVWSVVDEIECDDLLRVDGVVDVVDVVFDVVDVFDVVVLDEELLDEDEAAEDAQQQSSSSSLQDEEFVEEEEYE